MRIAIVGSGFAGSILARILQVQGHQVLLLDRHRHPRFALGESSTPLAAICLERLAARYGLDDLHALAAWGRWRERLPHLRRGLKRGFTFYGHSPGRPFTNSEANERRLLVAASPHDGVADTHWLRADVDQHLAKQAEAAGVEVLEEVELTGVEAVDRGWRLAGTHRSRTVRFEADLLVDASGAGGFLARHLPIARAEAGIAPDTMLVYGHFEGVGDFAGADFPPGPYPDEQAAVHHILEEGWMYVLPFDHGTVSAGFVISGDRAKRELAALPPERAWEQLLERYPTLGDQFASAVPARPVAMIPRLQHRLARAAGDRWALIPHAFCFVSPLFSTGIAWSLLAVERLALVLEGGSTADLDRYGALLAQEGDHLQRLVAGAYEAMRDFDLFAAYSYLYFAAASFGEASQRLLPAPEGGGPWAWEGFLGSGDPVLGEALDRILIALRETPRRGFENEVRRAIAPRNLAGLADPTRRRLYPVDLESLVEAAGLLGLTGEEIRREIPRLRGAR
ncbi:MAG: tetracycline 7-halogenase / O2-dependent halogenase [Acidobacteriota bacterium]|nr:tetracycline 7-halogenase / O2-dependent halogenase [Acidobacteriota bacterium]